MTRPQLHKPPPPLTLPSSCTPHNLLHYIIDCVTIYDTVHINVSAGVCIQQYCNQYSINDLHINNYINVVLSAYVTNNTLYNNIIHELYAAARGLNKSYQSLCSTIITLYYSLLRIQLITFDQLHRLLATQPSYIIYPILHFLSQYRSANVHRQLCMIWDQSYVNDTFITQLSVYDNEINSLLSKINTRTDTKLLKRSSTVPTEFKLSLSTQSLHTATALSPPQNRSIIPVQTKFHAQPVDPAIYQTSLQQINDAANQLRQQRVEQRKVELLQHAQPPSLTTAQRQRHKINKYHHVELNATQPLFTARPAPQFVPVDLPSPTRTQILRNELLYRSLEQQLHDESTLNELRQHSIYMTQLDIRDTQNKHKLVNQRKADHMQSKQKLIKSLHQQSKSNRSTATTLKRQLRQQGELVDQLNVHELHMKQTNVQSIQLQHSTALNKALHTVQQHKQYNAEQIKHQSIEHKQCIDQYNQQHLNEKQQLIHDIQVQQRISDARYQRYKAQITASSDTTTSGLTLLNSMSIVELYRRLQQIQQQNELDTQHKRQSIQSDHALHNQVYNNMNNKHNDKLNELIHQVRKHTKLVTKTHAALDNALHTTEYKTNACSDHDEFLDAVRQLEISSTSTFDTTTPMLHETIKLEHTKTINDNNIQQVC